MNNKPPTKIVPPKKRIIKGESSGKKIIEQGRGRLLCVVIFFALCFLTIGIRIIELSFPNEGLSSLFNKKTTREEPSILAFIQDRKALEKALGNDDDFIAPKNPQPRADIIDRNGLVLATSLETASLYANPKEIKHPKETTKQLLNIFPNLNEVKIIKRLSSDKSFAWIARNITPKQQYKANRLGIPGLYFQSESIRVYPQGPLLSHVIGFVGVDNNGLAGIEKYFDTRLQDKDNQKPLELSIDLRIQNMMRDALAKAMEEFQAIGATGLVINIRTGEVIAMSNLPEFDPQHPAAGDSQSLFNRATLGTYEMGSTFKAFTVAMGLDSGMVSITDSFDATNPIKISRFTIKDDHPQKRWLTVPEIFTYSSNIGTVKIAQKVGKELQQDYLRKLGLFDLVDIELPERALPIFPKTWSEIGLMTISYGHGISISPLHLAQAYITLVNDGIREKITLQKIDPQNKKPGERVISADASQKIRRLFRMVVQYGTGRKAEALGYRVGGKTGTAEKPGKGGYSRKANISSFAGIFPTDNPQYLVLAMLDEAQGNKSTYGFATAGWVAAPVVSKVISEMAPMLGVAPVFEQVPDEMDLEWEEMQKKKAGKKIHNAKY